MSKTQDQKVFVDTQELMDLHFLTELKDMENGMAKLERTLVMGKKQEKT